MSFNAFPIPDILEQLKSPVVDDKIHDIAERKHVFEGPMRLSPGRAYRAFVKAHFEGEGVISYGSKIQLSGDGESSDIGIMNSNDGYPWVFEEINISAFDDFIFCRSARTISEDEFFSSKDQRIYAATVPATRNLLEIVDRPGWNVEFFIIEEM